MKTFLKKSIDNGIFFKVIFFVNFAVCILAISFSIFTKEEKSFFNFHSWKEIGATFFLSLLLPLIYLFNKFEKNQTKVVYFESTDGLLLLVLGYWTIFLFRFERYKESNLASWGFIISIIFWLMAILLVYFKNKSIKAKIAEEKLAEEKRKEEAEASRKRNLDLVLSSFFFRNKATLLSRVNYKQVEDQIEFAELCLDITIIEDPEHLTKTIQKVAVLYVEHKELLTAVVLKRLTELRKCSVSELCRSEGVS